MKAVDLPSSARVPCVRSRSAVPLLLVAAVCGSVHGPVSADDPKAPAARSAATGGAARPAAPDDRGRFAFEPPGNPAFSAAGLGLRALNERTAGEGGPIGLKGGRLVHSRTGEGVRFWAVDWTAGRSPEVLRNEARCLAGHGVNLVRVALPMCDRHGSPDPNAPRRAGELVAAMKAEGIYTALAVYDPRWLEPPPDAPWLPGYDGSHHPFAALTFHPEFRKLDRAWWRALLLTPHPATRVRLVDEPALAVLEVRGDDSFFAPTFDPAAMPVPVRRLLETRFGDWLKLQYGALNTAASKWERIWTDRDQPGEGRMGLRAPRLAEPGAQRSRDEARFLAETQYKFDRDQCRFLRMLGYKGVLAASGSSLSAGGPLWELDRSSCTAADVVVEPARPGSGVSPTPGLAGPSGAELSALWGPTGNPGVPRRFTVAAEGARTAGRALMIVGSPGADDPLHRAAYGAMWETDAIAFATESPAPPDRAGTARPWERIGLTNLARFPGAAVLFRKGYVAAGDVVAELTLGPGELYDPASPPPVRENPARPRRRTEVPVVDPLAPLVGRVTLRFSDQAGPPTLKDLRPFVDRATRTVISSNRQLQLDQSRGILVINAPAAQGVSGNLRAAGPLEFADLIVDAPMSLAHVLVVSLDGRPLATSTRVLVQVVTEECPPAAGSGRTAGNLLRAARGRLRFKRPDAAALETVALDADGKPLGAGTLGADVLLQPEVLYYRVTPAGVSASR